VADRNVFLVYMPPTNGEAMVHYEDTIRKRVDLARVARHLTKTQVRELETVFGPRRMAVWGSRAGSGNRPKFERMAPGDDLLIVVGKTIKFMGKIALKTEDPALSRELWQNLRGGSGEGWDLIYFIANPVEIDVPFAAFSRLFNYGENFRLYGFTAVAPERLRQFSDEYGDLYDVLLRIKAGQPLEHSGEPLGDAVAAPASADPDDANGAGEGGKVSEHVRMQWMLANLGIKAGQKVWVPANDQNRLKREYDFDKFEREFASGIDLPYPYVKNIDVVWKEEFRVDAAFEVENSTSIYSGLLRFADLTVVAPNTIYPMFIVAPSERRNAVREQLRRPAFKQLRLTNKVKFLPYEAVDEIDGSFKKFETGVSVELIQARAEALVVP
jgi:hypothetical protein